MDPSRKVSNPSDALFRFAVVIYYGVLLSGFVLGMFGLISLLSLASQEIERNAHILN
jgi:hypothetical protein